MFAGGEPGLRGLAEAEEERGAEFRPALVLCLARQEFSRLCLDNMVAVAA